MARLPRLDLPGVPQHVIQRGNDRMACFAAEVDHHENRGQSALSPASESYGFDPLYRLSSLTNANGSTLESYTYNQTGDRTNKTASGLATGDYSYASGTHQLASTGNAARTNDANGNTTGSNVGGNAYVYQYSGRNRLTGAQLNGQTVGSYAYNALGERISKVATSPQSVTERYAAIRVRVHFF